MTLTGRFASRLPRCFRYSSVERFIELPSSAYTLVNGSSCPILRAFPGVAVAAAVAAAVGLGAVVAGPQAAASAVADVASRNLRRERRSPFRIVLSSIFVMPPPAMRPRRHSRSPVGACLAALAQFVPLDLARGVLRQLLDELDPARVLVRRDARLHELPELLGERVARRPVLLEHDEGLGLRQVVLVLHTDHAGLEDRLVRDERG